MKIISKNFSGISPFIIGSILFLSPKILKKLFNGEKLNFFIFKLRIEDNFDLADQFYNIHVISNYTLIALITLHIFAVLFHQIFLKENILKRMTK